MSEFAPGMRVIIRDEEWMIKKCDDQKPIGGFGYVYQLQQTVEDAN